ILEEIALCTWHGDGRTTTVKEIEKHCEALKTGQLFESFKVGLQSGVAKLFTAFYFREHNRRDTGDQAFEFTHKSFGEYLTGLRIMRAVETIQDEFDRHAKDMDKGWNEREALKHLAIVCGPTPMETYMLDYIRNEVKDRNESSVKKWQTTFGKLIKYVIEKDMPMEMTDLNKFADMRLQAINTEQALFVILNACNLQLKESFNIDIPNRDLLSNWIKRLLLVSGDTMKKCFSYLDLSHTNFTGSDFNKGDLQEVNFSDANLSRTNLRDADLSGSDLRRAYTRGSDLDGAKLNRADIYPRR
ncbi:MAG: pentapeptide repeat-containing protein, partial [Calditrichaeota bacterium]|nr:pentapeptide repeat-containing protein [Calditrichota bacterium]